MKSDGYNDSENPDVWRLVNVWIGVGQRMLYLDYEWECDKYHFYFYKNRKDAFANRPKNTGCLDVYQVESYLREKMPSFPLAKKVARTVAGKRQYYLTEDLSVTNAIMDDYDVFPALVNWFMKGVVDLGYAFDEEKPMFIIGEYSKVFNKLKRMGYKTHLEEEDFEVFDNINLEFVP